MYGKDCFLQLSQEAAVSVQIHSSYLERFSTTLQNCNVQTTSQLSILGRSDTDRDLRSERNDLVLQLNEYKVLKEYLKRQISEQELFVKITPASMKQLGKG